MQTKDIMMLGMFVPAVVFWKGNLEKWVNDTIAYELLNTKNRQEIVVDTQNKVEDTFNPKEIEYIHMILDNADSPLWKLLLRLEKSDKIKKYIEKNWVENFINELYPIYLKVQNNPEEFEKFLKYHYNITSPELQNLVEKHFFKREEIKEKKEEDINSLKDIIILFLTIAIWFWGIRTIVQVSKIVKDKEKQRDKIRDEIRKDDEVRQTRMKNRFKI